MEVIKMLNEWKNIIDRNADNWNKELETIKMNQSKIDNLEKIKIRTNDTEEWISDLEHRIIETNQSEQQTKKQIKIKATYKIYGITENRKKKPWWLRR